MEEEFKIWESWNGVNMGLREIGGTRDFDKEVRANVTCGASQLVICKLKIL
jgi:hypothetical protein